MVQRWLLRVGLAGLIAVCVSSASAQQHNKPPADAGWEEVQEPVFQLNVSPRLLIQALDLLVDKRLAKDYGLDEFQVEEMKQLLHREVPAFLQEHQAELEMLSTEWLEAISGPEPPSAEFAAQWAARFQPIVEEGEQMVGRVGEGMRDFLNDDQQVMLDSYLVATDIATKQIKGTLYEFEQGHFDPAKHWPGNRQVRRRAPRDIKKLESEMVRARESALNYAYESAPPPPIASNAPAASNRNAASRRNQTDSESNAAGTYRQADGREVVRQPTGEAPNAPTGANPAGESTTGTKGGKAEPAAQKHPWEIYVDEFITKYSLTEQQQQKARQFLNQALEQRGKFLSSNGQRMEKITKLFETAKTDEQRQTAEKAYKELNTPLDRMFDRLKSKLDSLPTRQQRGAAMSSPEKTTPKK